MFLDFTKKMKTASECTWGPREGIVSAAPGKANNIIENRISTIVRRRYRANNSTQ